MPNPFFRFHLTVDTLGFGCILPTAGRIGDFHPLERVPTGHTKKKSAGFLQRPLLMLCFYYILLSLFFLMGRISRLAS